MHSAASREWPAQPAAASQQEEHGENLAVEPQDERLVEEALEQIEEKFWAGELHELLGYVVKVPLTISEQHALGIKLRHPDPQKEPLLLDDHPETKFTSTEVVHIDLGSAMGNWNHLEILSAEMEDGEADIEPSINPVQEGNGKSIWLYSVCVDYGPYRSREFYGLDGIRLIQKVQREHRYKTGHKARLVLSFLIQRSFVFHYKARSIRGNALHLLAVARREQIRSPQVFDALINIEDLLEYPPLDLDWLHSECHFQLRGKNGRLMMGQCQALHLSAGRGNVAFMEILLEAGVDVNVKSVGDGKAHYTALHEAAFFKQTRALKFLLESGAKVNETNQKGQTSLHVAALQGGYELCRLMVKFNADVHHKDSSKRTALDLAMESGRYPHHKLFHLTGRNFSDLLKVATHSPQAASDLLRDVDADEIHATWVENLCQEMIESPGSSLEKWIDLLGVAPRAGEEVIEALTVAPPVKDASHHPLPRRVSMPGGTHFLCQYQPEDTWQYFGSENKVHPDWHRELCPGTETRFAPKPIQRRTERWLRQLYAICTGQSADAYNRVQRMATATNNVAAAAAGTNFRGRPKAHMADLVPVKVVMMKLPGIICPKVMYVLSTVTDRHIFVKIGVRAIVEYVWNNLVRYQYYTKTAQRMLVLVLFFCFVCLWIPEDPASIWRRGCWSLVAAQAYHELTYEIFEAIGHCFVLKLPQAYFYKLKNLCDYGSAALGLSLMHLSQHDLRVESWPILLAITVMGRWVMLTWTCRAFAWAGEKILPILQASCVPMGGILLVTGSIFLGFCHSFTALTLAQGIWEPFQVLLATLRLLLLGDGDGAAVILALYNGDEELGSPITFVLFSVAVIAFCICLLNLFIAVHGEAYDKAQETAHISFLQERAAICLNCLLMPKWPPLGCCKVSQQRRLCCVIYALSFVAWGVLIWMKHLHPWVASLTLLAGSLLADAVLLQLPWKKEDSQKYYFWICHRDDYDERFSAPAESELPGRLSSVKVNAATQNRRVSENLCNLRDRVARSNQSLDVHLGGLEQRLQSLEQRLTTANAALASFVPPVLE